MARAWMWIAGGAVALAAGAAGVGGYLLWRLDPRAEIERQIEAATGRDATINGEVSLSFFPTLGVTAADVTLANMPGGKAKNMIEAREIRIGVAAQPLMERRLVVRDLVLREPVIALEVGADAQGNWVFPALSKRPAKPGRELGEIRDVSFGDVRVERGRLTFEDLKTNKVYLLEAVDASAELDTLSGPLAISGAADRNGERLNLTMRFGEGRRLLTGGQTSLVLDLSSAPMQAKFEGVLASGGAEIDGKVEAKGASLRRSVALFLDPLPPGGGLEAFAISGQLTFDQTGARFENALFNLDGANGRGALRVELRPERPLLTGSAQIAALDLNTYMAEPAQAASPGATVGAPPPIDADAAGGWSEDPVDLAGMNGFDARFALTTGPVLVQKIKIDSARAQVALNSGVMSVKLEEATLYGGAAEGVFTLDARNPGMALRQDLIFSNVSATGLLKDAIGLDALEGAGQLEVTLAGDGLSQADFMRSLNGQVSFRLADGALKGVNLSGVATSISRALRGEFVGPRARTKFTNFAANFTIVDGVAVTRDFRMRADDAEISALGAIDLGQQRLDLRIVPKSETFASRVGFGFAKVAVPFHVSGPWTKPTYRTDLAAAAQGALAARVRSVEAQAAARLRERAGAP